MARDTREGECDCCRYETKLEKFRLEKLSPQWREDKREMWLCEVCSHSMVSVKAYEYPSQASEVEIIKAIAWIGNRILDEIRRTK